MKTLKQYALAAIGLIGLALALLKLFSPKPTRSDKLDNLESEKNKLDGRIEAVDEAIKERKEARKEEEKLNKDPKDVEDYWKNN